MHAIEEQFGKGCNLYELMGCSKDADKAALRKAYYRKALKVHPDKNPDNPQAAQKFQALSLAYQILQDADLRQEYNETGVIPHNDATAPDEDTDGNGTNAWKDYFDQIFGKVTTDKIEDFTNKYKCSDEEQRDVLKEFQKRQGNLVQMLEFVILSEPRDAVRWVEDFLRPAMEAGKVNVQYQETMEKSLKKIQKQIEKENTAAKDDDDETETEEDAPDEPAKSKTPPSKKRKARSNNKKGNSMDSLIAQIQNKHKRGGNKKNILSDLSARYGVADDADPLSDADFAKTQAQMEAKRRKKR